MKSNAQVAIVAMTTVALWAAWTEKARADWPFSFVQITCAPPLQYVSVRRLWIYNLQDRVDPKTIVEAEHRYGLFTSESLKSRPQICVIPSWIEGRGAISLIAKGEIKGGPDEMSYRRITNEVQVLAYGKLVATIGMNPYGISVGDDSVEIFANGPGVTIRKCSIIEPGSDLRRCTDEERSGEVSP
jgi:hypothetical protein